MPHWVQSAALFVAVSPLVYLAIALVLTFSQSPQQMAGSGGLDFSVVSSDSEPAPDELYFTARDGKRLGYHLFPASESAPLVVVVHGSGAFGVAYAGLARSVADAGVASVLLPDLRGHGAEANPRGDVAYIGQLEDDLDDLIKAHRKPGQKLVLLGHSSGGGLVVRFAGSAYGASLDGAILLAPFLKYNAPTMRPNSGGWAHPLTRRIIGLTMLNALRIRVLNHLPVIQFNIPDRVPDRERMTEAYSYRLNTSYAPRNDYLSDIAALPRFALIAGRNDEAFRAEEYQPLMQGVTNKGSYHILEHPSHLEVYSDAEALEIILSFLRDMK
ncbi:MAG: alpha/beta hydrolase [Rhodobacteraceae bacterium]|nr:alpha/beta hydrolase [Paracoccaceae bacterium]